MPRGEGRIRRKVCDRCSLRLSSPSKVRECRALQYEENRHPGDDDEQTKVFRPVPTNPIDRSSTGLFHIRKDDARRFFCSQGD